MKKYNTDYSLIELAKKFSDSVDEVEKMPCIGTKHRKTYWHTKLKAWFVEHFEANGIMENEEYRKLMRE